MRENRAHPVCNLWINLWRKRHLSTGFLDFFGLLLLAVDNPAFYPQDLADFLTDLSTGFGKLSTEKPILCTGWADQLLCRTLALIGSTVIFFSSRKVD